MARARKYFITAKADIVIGDLLRAHLPESVCSDTVLSAGGAWLNRQRVTDSGMKISSGQTVIVYHSDVQGRVFDWREDLVVDETDDFLIVVKPPGLTTVSDRSNQTYNLMASLEKWYQDRGQTVTLSPITRLDYMVSGLTLVTKHKSATRDFSKQTKQRKIGKYYVARLSWFDEAPSCLRCVDHLSHAGKAFLDPKGKRCESLFIRRQEAADKTWIEYGVKLFTGRRHQIRFHAAQYLRPLMGDGLYGDRKLPRESQIALWAQGLNFKYKGQRFRYRLDPKFYAKI